MPLFEHGRVPVAADQEHSLAVDELRHRVVPADPVDALGEVPASFQATNVLAACLSVSVSTVEPGSPNTQSRNLRRGPIGGLDHAVDVQRGPAFAVAELDGQLAGVGGQGQQRPRTPSNVFGSSPPMAPASPCCSRRPRTRPPRRSPTAAFAEVGALVVEPVLIQRPRAEGLFPSVDLGVIVERDDQPGRDQEPVDRVALVPVGQVGRVVALDDPPARSACSRRRPAA